MTPTRLSVWPPLPPSVHARPSRQLPFPFDGPMHRFYRRARHALWHGLRAAGLAPGSVILAPAFHHGSEIEALLRAGLEVRFYDAGDHLEPGADLEGLMDERVIGIQLTHVLGVPQEAERWRRWADERGLMLVEDVAQGWPGNRGGRPLGSWGDISIFCVYKTFGVPDGGVLHARWSAPEPAAGGTGVERVARRHAAWMLSRSSWAATALLPLRKKTLFSHEDDIALGDPDLGPTGATRRLLPRVYEPAVARKRRANFHYLRTALSDHFSPSFDVDLDGASPFAFPIEVADKNEIDSRLAAAGIHAERFWALPHPALPVEGFPRAARLRERLLALPVHQELSATDLHRIAETVGSMVS